MKTILVNALKDYSKGMLVLFIWSPVLTLTVFGIGLLAKVLWTALICGFNLIG